MDINKINRLDNEINQKSFEKANSSNNSNWYWTSITFQVLNVIICFFGFYLFTNKVIDDFPFKMYVLGILSIVVLYFWERLKRVQIRSSVMNFLRAKKQITFKQLPNLSLTLFLIICSSLIAINGGNELSDKTDKIETNNELAIKIEKDSIVKYYSDDIKKLEYRVDYIINNAKNKTGESRSLKKNEIEDIDNFDNSIKSLKIERDKSLTSIDSKYTTKVSKLENKNSNIVLIFVIGSIIVEFFILFGIRFTTNYDFKYHQENINSEGYKKYNLYMNYISILYENGKSNVDDKVLSEAKFIEFVKLKFKNTLHTKEFMTIVQFLKIIETRTDRRKYFIKSFDEAKQEIIDYLKTL